MDIENESIIKGIIAWKLVTLYNEVTKLRGFKVTELEFVHMLLDESTRLLIGGIEVKVKEE